MSFDKLSIPSLKDLFVDRVEDMILSGKLEIGEKLPSERELAETMEVSRSVINSGIKEMEAKGFLEVKPRMGTYVADYRRNGTMETLLSIMKYNGGQLKKSEVRSLLEFKIVLDQFAVRLFLNKFDATGLKSLKSHLNILEASENLEDVSLSSFNFYHELAVISGNTILPLIYYSFKTPILSLWDRFGSKYGKESLVYSTTMLYRSIEDRDIDGALNVIAKSLTEVIEGTREIYEF